MSHAFHPLNGRGFEAVDISFCWGEDRVYYDGGDGGLRRMPLDWTSLRAPDPFVEISAGRSAFRFCDLLALCDLVDCLKRDRP